jgi:glycosyltransferase involved in cell wall biosynthesis
MKAVCLIPAYNEEKNIEEVLRRVGKTGIFSEIIVVNDGSKDRTAEVAEGLKNSSKTKITVLLHEKNKGKGEALKTGFEYVLKTNSVAAVIMDADMQYPPEQAEKIIEPIEGGRADFVMGFRDFRKVPFRHRLGNFVWKTSFNILFGTKLRDTNCGLMALSRKAMENVGTVYGGYIIENAMLASMVKKRLRIGQVPVAVDYHRASGIKRGIRMVSGVLFFIIKEGLKYRLGIK